MKNRWMMNRMGLINFWYYDKEEFEFSNGRLLLRGANGSGKSVTMQSFIPLLLDGNKSPERLDPFGSRARKIENYLLGEEEDDREERTGYLYMEFKREDTENYITLGMGLKARRGKSLDFWGFSITDGRRIGTDLQLYKEMGDDIPLSKKELKNRIADGGEVTEGQRDYMKMVNKLLFGFENIEEYDELIKLLVQLRTPKLSKDFKPTVIYEIMNNALQPLTDEDLRPMSEAIENMDNIKSQLEALKGSKKAAERIKAAYDQYNRYILFEKSKDFVRADEGLGQMQKEKNSLESERLRFSAQFEQANARIEELDIQEKIYKEKERELRKHDSFEIKEKITQLEKSISDDAKEKQAKDSLYDEKRTTERQLAIKIKAAEGEEAQKIQEIKGLLDELDELAELFYFSEQTFLKDELLKNTKAPYDFQYVDNQFRRYRDRISGVYQLLQKEAGSAKAYDAALAQLEEAKAELEAVKRQEERSQQLLLETKEEFVEGMYQWEKGNQYLKLSREALVETTQRIHQYGEKTTYDDLLKPIRKHHGDYAGEFNKEKNHWQKKKGFLLISSF